MTTKPLDDPSATFSWNMQAFVLASLFCYQPQTAVNHIDLHTSCRYCEHAPGNISDRGNGAQGTISEFVDNLKLGSVANCEEDGVKLQKGHGQVADEIQS